MRTELNPSLGTKVVDRFAQLRVETTEMFRDPTLGTKPLTQAQINSLKVRTQVQIDDERRQRLGDNGPEVGP